MSDISSESSSSSNNHRDMNNLWTSPPSHNSHHSRNSRNSTSPPTLEHVVPIIPSYIRELIYMLDPENALGGVDLNDESSVRHYMKGVKEDRLRDKIIRLRRLRSFLSRDFSNEEVSVVDHAIKQCLSEFGEDADMFRVESRIRVDERNRALEHAVESKLLSEEEDEDVFNFFIQSQVKLMKSLNQ